MKLTGTLGLVLLVIAVMIGYPFALIWSLNTLFDLGIGYTFWTWLAALVCGATVYGSSATSSGK